MHRGLVVDLFAGGGGASEGIRLALGRDPDVAVNHDRIALAMHEANHPGTLHLREDVWDVDPVGITHGRPVALLWASPDCKHFSRAKGGPPIRSKKIRSLAQVVIKWAQQVRPRVILLENVMEFQTWGPLDATGKIIEAQKGLTFRTWIWQLRREGYTVQYKCLSACDYGAPTIRRRLFLIARCDGQSIVWPEPTHGPGLIPYRTAAECIDWSIPCPSIFDRKRPLAENTQRRIAEGTRRYVIEAAEPFIVPIQHYNGPVNVHSINEPLRTITAQPKGGSFVVVVPHVTKFRNGSVGSPVDQPLATVTANSFVKRPGGAVPLGLVAAHLQRQFGNSIGQSADAPIGTITAGGGGKTALVAAFLCKYYGHGGQHSACSEPMHTIPTKDRMGLVTVTIAGEPYVITDIGMRMLQPKELFRAQGFSDDYRIDLEVDGRRISKSDQVRLCGNSVCPPIAAALVRANVATEARRLKQVP